MFVHIMFVTSLDGIPVQRFQPYVQRKPSHILLHTEHWQPLFPSQPQSNGHVSTLPNVVQGRNPDLRRICNGAADHLGRSSGHDQFPPSSMNAARRRHGGDQAKKRLPTIQKSCIRAAAKRSQHTEGTGRSPMSAPTRPLSPATAESPRRPVKSWAAPMCCGRAHTRSPPRRHASTRALTMRAARRGLRAQRERGDMPHFRTALLLIDNAPHVCHLPCVRVHPLGAHENAMVIIGKRHTLHWIS